MGENSAIGWTDHTFNPWMGCTKVSPACDHCYAEALGKRTGRVQWGDEADRVVTGDSYWRNPRKWNTAAEAAGRPALVFCASLADVFEDRPELAAPRARLFALIEDTPNLIWLLLTKRPQHVLDMVPAFWIYGHAHRGGWPANAWIGTTVEDQEHADERIPHLAAIPAPVRFLSVEPMLGYVDLLNHVEAIDWVICGGESGPGHRPLDLGNARRLQQQCHMWDVPFFFKQIGGRTPTAGGDLLDGARLKAFPPEARR